jgi:hypothetical protein
LLDGIDQFLVLRVDQHRVGQALVGRDFLRVPVSLDGLDVRGRSRRILPCRFGSPAVALAEQECERQRDDQHEDDLRERCEPCLRGF